MFVPLGNLCAPNHYTSLRWVISSYIIKFTPSPWYCLTDDKLYCLYNNINFINCYTSNFLQVGLRGFFHITSKNICRFELHCIYPFELLVTCYSVDSTYMWIPCLKSVEWKVVEHIFVQCNVSIYIRTNKRKIVYF